MSSEFQHLNALLEAFEPQIEKVAAGFFQGKDRWYVAQISHGELVNLMTDLVRDIVGGTKPQVIPSIESGSLSELVQNLYGSHEANTLPHQAARAIEKLDGELQTEIFLRNAGKMLLDEAVLQTKAGRNRNSRP